MKLGTMILAARKKLQRAKNARRAKMVARQGGAKVAIVSCDRWAGKIYDDLLVQGALLKQGLAAEIVSWQDAKVDWASFDAAVVGSMWGYQNFLPELEKWFAKVEKATKLVNPAAVIRANYDKARQLKALTQAGVPTIKTRVVKVGGLAEFKLPQGEFVIKPAISGSGEGAFLIRGAEDLTKAQSELKRLNATKELLVQEFVPEIGAGELGVVMIGGEIVNVVRRFPGVLAGNYHVQAEKQAPRAVQELARKIAGLAEYREAKYLRVDVVERKDGPVVMEVEAFEPQLYYYLQKGAARAKMLAKMVAEVKKAMKAESENVGKA